MNEYKYQINESQKETVVNAVCIICINTFAILEIAPFILGSVLIAFLCVGYKLNIDKKDVVQRDYISLWISKLLISKLSKDDVDLKLILGVNKFPESHSKSVEEMIQIIFEIKEMHISNTVNPLSSDHFQLILAGLSISESEWRVLEQHVDYNLAMDGFDPFFNPRFYQR